MAFVLAAAGAAFAASAGKPGSVPNPDGALTTSQRDALYQQTERSFQERYAAWLSSPAAKSQDLRSLPRRPMAASYVPALPSLPAARSSADAIFGGVVLAVDFRPGSTILTVRPDRVAKGQVTSDVRVVVGGGLFPEPDFVHASLTVSAAAPLLLPGDRAVWVLQRTGPSDGSFAPQSFTGEYLSVGGRVQALPGNPFADLVNGLTEAQLLSRLSA